MPAWGNLSNHFSLYGRHNLCEIAGMNPDGRRKRAAKRGHNKTTPKDPHLELRVTPAQFSSPFANIPSSMSTE